MKWKLIIDIKVIDLDRAIEFYRDKLGLTCRTTKDDWAAILVGDAEIHLYLNGGATSDVEFYVNDIDLEVQRLSKNGVIFISGLDKPSSKKVDEKNITTFPWGRTAFFKDSEGNELAIVQDF